MTPEETQRRVATLESQVQKLSRKVDVVQAQPQGAVQSQPGPTISGDLPAKLKNIFNWGFEWISNKVNVKPKVDGGITVDASGVGVKVKSNSGLLLDTNGLSVLLEANKGLSEGSAGIATVLKAKGGILVGSSGLYLDLLLGVVTPLTPGAIVAIDFSLGCGFTLTPGEDETLNGSNGVPGQRAALIVTTSGVTPRTLTFGANFKSQGVLVTGAVSGKVFVFSFFTPDGTTWYEESRTTAI